MENNIRSEYIKNLVEDRDRLTQKLEETTKNTLQNVVNETINKQLRQMISEANDDYEVEEVKPDADDTATSDAETPVDGAAATTDDVTATDGGDDAGAAADAVAGAEGGENPAGADDATSDDIWGGLEQYKGDDGEYDLTSMDKDDVIKVLKVMGPEDGVRVLKNDNGTVTLQDDETDKEYIIDMDGSTGSNKSEETNDDDEISIDLGSDDDAVTDECNVKPGANVNEGEVNLGYTDNYQKKTAMTTPDNHEPADKKNTYSMDAGVPTGTEKPWVGHKGDMSPFGKKVNEGEACAKCGKNPCECNEEQVNETMTSTENSANVRNTGMTHANTNDKGKQFRNSSEGGVKVKGTGENSYSKAQVESVMRKANAIFKENQELRKVAEAIKGKLEEAIVVNSSLGNIIKLVTENSTTLDEKKDIIKRFDNVKTINEGKNLYNTIAEELKKAGKVNNTSENKLDNQLAESKKTKLVETTMYQSADLSATISLMERLNKL